MTITEIQKSIFQSMKVNFWTVNRLDMVELFMQGVDATMAAGIKEITMGTGNDLKTMVT